MREVLLDSGALYASLDIRDQHHRQAQAFMANEDIYYVVLDTIFSEAMTLLKSHVGVQVAVTTGKALLAGPPFRFHRLSDDQAALTWRYFTRYTDKAWSYADCSLLAAARATNVLQVFSFDRHFDQMAGLGIERVP